MLELAVSLHKPIGGRLLDEHYADAALLNFALEEERRARFGTTPPRWPNRDARHATSRRLHPETRVAIPRVEFDVAKSERVSRSILLKDGSAVSIDVMAYVDPAMEAVHRGIYDTSIIQAAGRPCPLERTADNPATTYVFANVALPFPVDSVSRWQDVWLDRIGRMIAGGAVWTSTADMPAFRPDLFKSQKAAEHAVARSVESVRDITDAVRAVVRNDTRPWAEIKFSLSPPAKVRKGDQYLRRRAQPRLSAARSKPNMASQWNGAYAASPRAKRTPPSPGFILITQRRGALLTSASSRTP